MANQYTVEFSTWSSQGVDESRIFVVLVNQRDMCTDRGDPAVSHVNNAITVGQVLRIERGCVSSRNDRVMPVSLFINAFTSA